MSTSSDCIPLAVIDVLLLVLVIMAALQMKDIDYTKTGIVPSKVCVPCEAVYVNPTFKSVSPFTVTGPEDRETCCLKTETDVDKLVELMSERAAILREGSEPVTEGQWNYYINITGSQPTLAIKLVGWATHQTGKGNGVVSWDTGSPNSFATKWLEYNKAGTKVKVKQSGSYFIYSQVTFQTVASTSLRNVLVTVIRETSIIEERLMSRSETLANMSTLYLGGSFDLKKWDHVKKYVENLENIVPSAIYNVFGMFLS